ncbi:MAG: S9 family peptidase [Acidobacteria bacterium]|nr:S9 family peptidase [Acidobacteriota bacterium]
MRFLFCLLALIPAAQAARVPTVDDLIKLQTPGGVQISPDGRYVAYTVREADFEQNAYVTHIWVAETASGRAWQLTRGKKSARAPRWSPDGRWLAFSSDREGGKNQLFAIPPDGGEAVQLTKAATAVGAFAWSTDGKQVAFTAPEKEPQALKDRKGHLGEFQVVRKDYSYSHLWTIDVAEAMKAPVEGRQRTKGRDFTVRSFSWSPDGARIAFSATIDPDLVRSDTADLYVLALAGDAVMKLVSQPGPDSSPEWSPDGKWIAFSSSMGSREWFFANRRIAIVPAQGGTPKSLTDSFDEDPFLSAWKPDGIYFGAIQKTAMHLFRIDPPSGRITRVTSPDSLQLGFGASFTQDGKQMAFTLRSAEELSDVYLSAPEPFKPRRLTNFNAAIRDWTLPREEVIAWTSKDGTRIEGVLAKPADFDPAKKYALLCVIHGGPTGVDWPQPVHTYAYPVDLWAARGALTLRVNYRGSGGYGERFRKLNVRNLGVGDAWDVESGVDYLISKGWVDPKRVGAMGWSQGGYISAFLATASTKFAAISVGAGISNWATYYYNTDITPFTIHYLGDDPVDDPEIYRKTSPMSYIKQARTPVLIQHGELDRRVPIPNAYELRQGLEDRGVPVEMIVYKGFGHGIDKPKEARALMQHNLEWFNHYLWGDPRPDFLTPKVPKAAEKKEGETRGP